MSDTSAIQTQVIPINPLQPERQLIQQAARLIQMGEMVVFPTETVYGLGADALNPAAAEHIFAAKGRPYSDPLIVHIAHQQSLEELVTTIPAVARDLIEAFWPGPLTLILPASSRVPELITAGLPNVAIRMPQHPVARALIEAAGTPIAAPSANRFMHVSPTTAQHALTDLAGRVPLILDGGPCTVGVESTVLNLSVSPPTILRPGGISLEALQQVLPTVQIYTRPTKASHQTEVVEINEENTPLAAPGQMHIHYSPTVPAYLYEGSITAMRQTMLEEVQKRQHQGEQVGLLIANEDQSIFESSGAKIYLLGKTPDQIANHLFAGLRTLEEARVDCILCRSFPEEGLGRAIRDRLQKAAGGKIIICN